MKRILQSCLPGICWLSLGIAACHAQSEGQDEGPVVQKSTAMAIGVQGGEGGAGFEMVISDDAGNVNFMTSSGPMGMFTMGGDMLGSPMPGFGGDMMSMLNQSAVQKDLDLSDDQQEQLRRLRQDFSQRMSEHVKALRDGNGNIESARNLGEVVRDLQRQQKADLEQILMPHQMRRLQEISIQARMKQMGPAGMMNDRAIAEELGISDEQLKRMRERAKEVAESLKEKIEKLREEARQELLKELTREQLDKLERMMGDQFTFPKETEVRPSPPGTRVRRLGAEGDR